MPAIDLNTLIRAPRERVFDLARSIDAHQDSTRGTEEPAVVGVTKGLIGMGGEVTWEARHFGIRQRLTICATFETVWGQRGELAGLSGVFDRPVPDDRTASGEAVAHEV